MKTSRSVRKFPVTFTAALLLLLPSCDKDEDDFIIWDMYPVCTDIHIKDASGNNLLNPSVPGNLVGKRIVAEYDGKEYELDWDSEPLTRYYHPDFTGLTLACGYTITGDSFQPDPEKAYLSFGEFDGATDQDISLTLRIEGYPDTWDVEVIHRINWNGNQPNISNTALLNGTEVSYYEITITL